MGKLLKVLGWLIGMLVVLIVAAIILVPMFVDLNDHKDRIVLEVKKATGRDLDITGEIGLSVFPRFALKLNGLSLSNAPGFEADKFAAVKHAQVEVDMIPLLFRQVLMADTLKIEGLVLNLAKSKQGVANWEDMLGKQKETELYEQPTEVDGGDGGMMAFNIGGVTIKDARVVWDDQSTGERYDVANLNLETGKITPGRPVDISFSTALQSRKPQLKGQVELTGQLRVDDEHSMIMLDDMSFKTEVSGEGLPEQGVRGVVLANLRYNQAHDVLDVTEFKMTSGRLALTGALTGLGLTSNPQLKGDLRLLKFSPREWLEAFGLPVPETADPKVLDALELSSQFRAGADEVEFKNLHVKLDQTVVKGELELINLAQPAYFFDLNVDRINLDRYLPPPQEGAPQGQPAKSAGGGNEELFPVEILRQLRIDGKLLIDRLTVNQLHAEAVQVKVRGRDGKLTVDQEIGRFYDGLTKGSVTLDVAGKTPKMNINQSLSRVLTGPLLKDLMGDDKLLGSGSVDLNLTGTGGTVDKIKRTLSGNLSFDFRDGAVKGFNLAKMIRDTKARLSGEAVSLSNEEEQTDFSELSGSATIVNGLVNNQQLLAKSPYLRINGAGKANLLQESLDYTIRPVIVNTPKGQGGQGLEELVGIPIPVRIHGSWSDPQFKIQLAQILEEQQKAKLKEKLDSKVEEKLQEKVPEELQDKVKDKLKKLF
ncbi:MAG: AsmA family protein [Chromatiales bacterium]|jgi:AsmA protein